MHDEDDPTIASWPTEAAGGSRIRVGTRALLVDPDDRVLLFRTCTEHGEWFWFPPGGGVEPGESVFAAVRREILEETGHDAPAELRRFGHRRLVLPVFGSRTDIREHWFFARVPVHDIVTTGWTELENATIEEHRWWPVRELRGAVDRLVPEDLADVLDALLRDGPPATVIELGR